VSLQCSRPGCDGERYDNKGRAHKIFNYFSPITQLCNRVWWKNFIAQLYPLRKPDDSDLSEDSPIHHVHDSNMCKKWREVLWQKKILQMANGVVLFLVLSSDGYNPFNSGVYSVAFIALRIMSYRKEFGYKLEHIIHVGLVPGPQKPFSLQPYLDILVDDLLLLAGGIACPNPCNPTEIKMLYAFLLLVAADYPGHSEIHGMEGHTSRNGCYKCEVMTYNIKGSKQICACRYRDLLTEDEDKAMGERTRTTRMPPPNKKSTVQVKEWAKDVERTGIANNGVKEVCALSRLPYYAFVESMCLDYAHTGRNVWTHIRAGMCSQINNTKPPEPKKPDFTNKNQNEKRELQKKYVAAIKVWKAKCAARSRVLEEAQIAALSADDLRGCDVRYRWAASPGLADHDKTIMFRKGDLNFHRSVALITTKLLLYCLYPYCDPIFYAALVGLVEVWTVLLDPEKSKRELVDYMPILITRMGVWEKIAPFTCLGYMFHAPEHLLEMRIEAGCVQQYWMYFFERFVAYLRRLCKSRVHPEANMSIEAGVHMYLDEVTYSRYDVGQLVKADVDPLARVMLNSLNLDADDFSSTADTPVYTLPKRLREYRSLLLSAAKIQELCDVNNLSLDFSHSIAEDGCEVYRYPAKTVNINGLPRTAISNEPSIGSSVYCVRKSGFRYVGTDIEHKNNLVGTICRWLVVNGTALFVVVKLYQLETHTESTLERICLNDELNINAVIPAAAIGDYVVFAPWADRTKLIDKTYLCVLYRSGESTYAN
jgi:hypothetical protein